MNSIAQSAPAQHPAIIALQRAKERVKELEGYLTWEDQLFSNPALSPADKLTLRATRRAAERGQTRDEAGRTRINLGIIAEQIGMSPDTVGRRLNILQSAGAVSKETRHELQESGDMWRRVYVAIEEPALHKPREIAPETPRNHGGKRYFCPKCGNERVTIRKKLILICPCGHESLIEETDTLQEPENPLPQDAAKGEPTGNLPDVKKPVTPPYAATCGNVQQDGLTEAEGVVMSADDMARRAEENLALQWKGAKLLLAIAGDAPQHIKMPGFEGKKYATVAEPLTDGHTLAHLQGRKVYGASCGYGDGTTRALCYDADEPAAWQQLEAAARKLADAEYMPLLEQSPAGRGGHLWVIYDDLVNAEAARSHAHSIASELAAIAEYWPGPKDAKNWNRVRLPGGKYIYTDTRTGQEINAWCPLKSAATGEIARNGADAAALLLSHLSPARIVPQVEQNALPIAAQETPAAPPTQERRAPRGSGVDERWQRTYGNEEGQRLWFAWTASNLADWWNRRHPLSELETNRGGYIAADWRGETEPSVYIRQGKEQFEDYGASARQESGSPDTGDALELEQRRAQQPKYLIMQRAARERLAEARRELESAARGGQPIPASLADIITPAGRAHYEALRRGRPQEAQGGVTGFSTEAALAVPSEKAQELMAAHGLTHGGPCGGCACELYRNLMGSPACVRCLPPKGYGEFSEQIDLLYPRKKAPSFGREIKRGREM
jgi:DNA-binding transcriptional ArsR family regulator